MTRSKADFTDNEIERIKDRDRRRCLVCGSVEITIQHRRAKGMDGLSDKAFKLSCADGLVLCWFHNNDAEGAGQERALRRGWKVLRNCAIDCADIPYYDAITGNWFLPDAVGGRRWVDPGWAAERVRLANELP